MSDTSEQPVWRLEPHVCNRCYGRVLSRNVDGGARIYRCAECGNSATGKTSQVICSCGMKLGGKKDMGIRCMRNENRRPEFMVEFCAQQT